MKSGGNLELLFGYASLHEFDEFEKMFEKLERTLPVEELQDAYLMRAQIKLLAADDTLLEDLEKAERGTVPRLPCLNDKWVHDGANRFFVFKNKAGWMQSFLRQLPLIEEKLGRWYGESGAGLARQVRSDILYYLGRFHEAILLETERQDTGRESSTSLILSKCILFRCYLAGGHPDRAEECMLETIRLSRLHPECLDTYYALRGWANLTTGWSGDNPRFYEAPDGKTLPVLEDRLAAIRGGISRLNLLEERFVSYAEQSYEDTYTLRQYYMGIFHAIYWFNIGDSQQTAANFMQAYRVAKTSGLIMPFVEYGKQIIPLLRYVKDSNMDCSNEWLSEIISLAELYERNINAYRDASV